MIESHNIQPIVARLHLFTSLGTGDPCPMLRRGLGADEGKRHVYCATLFKRHLCVPFTVIYIELKLHAPTSASKINYAGARLHEFNIYTNGDGTTRAAAILKLVTSIRLATETPRRRRGRLDAPATNPHASCSKRRPTA